jgi:hypothetical protein
MHAPSPRCTRDPTQARSRNCAGPPLRPQREIGRASIPNRLPCALASSPPHYAQGDAEISKNPNPRPSLLLILHPHWSLQLLASPYRTLLPREPCQFDVPGVAPSTLTDFARVAKQRRGRGRQLRPSPDDRGRRLRQRPQRPGVAVPVVATALSEPCCTGGLSSHAEPRREPSPPPPGALSRDTHRHPHAFCTPLAASTSSRPIKAVGGTPSIPAHAIAPTPPIFYSASHSPLLVDAPQLLVIRTQRRLASFAHAYRSAGSKRTVCRSGGDRRFLSIRLIANPARSAVRVAASPVQPAPRIQRDGFRTPCQTLNSPVARRPLSASSRPP